MLVFRISSGLSGPDKDASLDDAHFFLLLYQRYESDRDGSVFPPAGEHPFTSIGFPTTQPRSPRLSISSSPLSYRGLVASEWARPLLKGGFCGQIAFLSNVLPAPRTSFCSPPLLFGSRGGTGSLHCVAEMGSLDALVMPRAGT